MDTAVFMKSSFAFVTAVVVNAHAEVTELHEKLKLSTFETVAVHDVPIYVQSIAIFYLLVTPVLVTYIIHV